MQCRDARRTLLALGLALPGFIGCAGSYSTEAADNVPEVEKAANAVEVADEVFNDRGQRFVRVAAMAPSEREAFMARIKSAELTATSPVERLAERIRGHMLRGGEYYVQAEPELALAEQILYGEGAKPSEPGRVLEGRDTKGADDRGRVNPTTAYPWTTMAFNDLGCSGTMIGRSTMITAAHCVYDTVGGNDEWYCRDGTTDPTGACDDQQGDLRHRFGANGTGGVLDWIQCYTVTVPGCFISQNTLSGATDAGCDYAVVDFTVGNGACPNPTPGNTTSWLGTWVLNNTDIASKVTLRYGYPMYAPCNSNVNGGNSTDCPAAGAFNYSGSPVPFSGGELWGMSAAAGATTAANSNALLSTIDWTPGDSGSSIWFVHTNGARYVIGDVSNSPTSGNYAARWTSTTFNFFDANSQFPADTI